MDKRKIQYIQWISLLLFVVLSLYSFANEPIARMAHTARNHFSVFIMDQGQCSSEELAQMLIFYNPTIDASKAQQIASVYIEEAKAEGVNPDIAFSQMCLETGFLTYGGSVQEHQNNFCGLGAVSKNQRGESFPDMETGIRAHIQHLKAYASKSELIQESVDRRFRFVSRGSAPTIYQLPGKWASDKNYAIKLEDLLNRLFLIKLQLAQTENIGMGL